MCDLSRYLLLRTWPAHYYARKTNEINAATRFPICAKPERLPASRPRFFGAAEFRPGAQAGGRFLLRIEDIDATRCRPEFEAAIYEDLAWLGISWETPVRRQSEHFSKYRDAVEKLSRAGPDLSRLRKPRRNRPSGGRTGSRRTVAARSRWRAALSGRGEVVFAEARRQLIEQGVPYALRLDMAAALRRRRRLNWVEHGEGPDGETGVVTARPRGLGRCHPGAQGNADQLSFVGRDRRRAAGRHRVVRGQDLFWSTSVHRLLQALLGLPRRSIGITGWCSMAPGTSCRSRPGPPHCANCAGGARRRISAVWWDFRSFTRGRPARLS